jgi:hypothetical protein
MGQFNDLSVLERYVKFKQIIHSQQVSHIPEKIIDPLFFS